MKGTVTPTLLPSVTLADHVLLPELSGIYFALLGQHVLYIGKAKNLNRRWRDHHRRAELTTAPNVRLAYLSCPVGELERTEKALIHKFLPPMNSIGYRRPNRLTDAVIHSLTVRPAPPAGAEGEA